MSRGAVDKLKYEYYERELLNPMRGHDLTDLERHIGNYLLDGSSEKPIGIIKIITNVELYLNRQVSPRTVKRVIRLLRKEHCFPILARRIKKKSKKSTGYWWSASSKEMQEFIESYKSQALDELHTLSRMVKLNYPELAGQLRIDLEAGYE